MLQPMARPCPCRARSWPAAHCAPPVKPAPLSRLGRAFFVTPSSPPPLLCAPPPALPRRSWCAAGTPPSWSQRPTRSTATTTLCAPWRRGRARWWCRATRAGRWQSGRWCEAGLGRQHATPLQGKLRDVRRRAGRRCGRPARACGGHGRQAGPCMRAGLGHARRPNQTPLWAAPSAALAAVRAFVAARLSWQHIARSRCSCTLPMLSYWAHLSLRTFLRPRTWARGLGTCRPHRRLCAHTAGEGGSALLGPKRAHHGWLFSSSAVHSCGVVHSNVWQIGRRGPLMHSSSHLCCLLRRGTVGEEHPRHSVY